MSFNLKDFYPSHKKEIIIYLIAISIVVIALIYINKRNKNYKIGKKMYTFKDSGTAAFINGLHPSARNRFADFITEVESPTNGKLIFLVTSGTRSFAKQASLANGGGDTSVKVSLHNFGFALDGNIYGIDKSGKKIDLHLTSPEANWLPYVRIAQKYGLTWGGTFKNTKVPDRVHFSYGGESKAKDYLALYNSNKKDSNGFVIV